MIARGSGGDRERWLGDGQGDAPQAMAKVTAGAVIMGMPEISGRSTGNTLDVSGRLSGDRQEIIGRSEADPRGATGRAQRRDT